MRNAVPLPIQRLIEAFGRLPGIGPKTASRLTYYLLRAPESESRELASALEALHSSTQLCKNCFSITGVDSELCLICSDPSRDTTVICVVEEPLDVIALERTGQYSGHYHVLHGAISPIEGIGPEDLKIRELIDRIGSSQIKELVIATNPTMEGEATAKYIRQSLGEPGCRITRLARGLPSGGDLEYADAVTLGQALEGRSEM